MDVTNTHDKYFAEMFGDITMRHIFSDIKRIETWITVEVVLANAQERCGLIPKGVGKKLQEAAKTENIDHHSMKADFEKTGFPILPFVKQLTSLCDSETARWIHYGATTQDILDTGTTLQIKEGLEIIEKELNAISQALVKLAKKHRDTPMAGRTFMQLAAPITFGYKAAVWLDELLRHCERLEEIKKRVLVGQCAGAVGTYATLGDKGLEVQRLMMEELGLGVPDITWHTARDRWSELVSFFAMLAATFAKIATEIATLMRSEIGELSEPFETGRGASTTLPQKRNPISCEPIIANAHRLREMSSSQMVSMIQEHERGALGQMHIEWTVIPESFILLSGVLKHSRFLLENLWVDEKNMCKNLDLNGSLIMSEAVMMGLAPKVGKSKAHHLVYTTAGKAMDSGITLREALIEDTEISGLLTIEEIDKLLDPINYTGSAGAMVDRVLEKFEKMKSTKSDE
jgi:3-carboxy-cis,cis-muconate cycloisomerase